MIFVDRKDAGRKLAQELLDYADNSDTIILALPRGGVPVAHEVARSLHLPLDVLIVRKLSLPFNEELAMGAIGPGGETVMNKGLMAEFKIDEEEFDHVIRRESKELERRNSLYRKGKDFPDVAGKTIILIDDGIATGATLFVAIKILKAKNPQKIVVAVPVGPETICKKLKGMVDEVICLISPPNFYAVGQVYLDFSQTSDEEVQELLTKK